jgi:hypothetical protein
MDIVFTDDKAELYMKGYIDQLLRQYDITSGVNAPASNNLFVINNDSALLDDDLKHYFHSAVAKLLYLGKRMRAILYSHGCYISNNSSSASYSSRFVEAQEIIQVYIYQTEDWVLKVPIFKFVHMSMHLMLFMNTRSLIQDP